MNVVVRGESVAAQCSTYLLSNAGLKPVVEGIARPRLPAIMLSEAALSLMRSVFDRPALFIAAPRINRRVVKWGRNAQPVVLDHAAVVVSEPELLSQLEPGVETVDDSSLTAVDFTIFASRPLPPGPVEYCFGSRLASAAKVHLKDARDSTSCWIESLENGWLFLIPNASESGWLLSVGGPPQALLERSLLITGRIARMDEPVGQFPASPRIVSPLCGPGWVACGTAGMAFDPICGDGTGHAIREAILASAVVRGIAQGGNAQDLLAHYEARLTLGFQRHLADSLEHYRSGNSGPWWQTELKSLEGGLEWCANKMKGYGEFRYRLNGFELSAMDRAG